MENSSLYCGSLNYVGDGVENQLSGVENQLSHTKKENISMRFRCQIRWSLYSKIASKMFGDIDFIPKLQVKYLEILNLTLNISKGCQATSKAPRLTKYKDGFI